MSPTGPALYSAAQLREREALAFAHGVDPYVLMQRAGEACWREISARWPSRRRIHVVCGPGNNGGDGYVVAQLAAKAGRQVSVWSVGVAAEGGLAARARLAWKGAAQTWASGCLADADLVVDALLGIGVDRPLEGALRHAVEEINARAGDGVPVFAVDLPSGVDADTGSVQGVAVCASATLSFVGRKYGLYTGEGVDLCGERLFDPLGLADSREVACAAELVDREALRTWLPRRRRSAHKGEHGHVLLVGGDAGTPGAILLAARAALRAGAGLVTVATRLAHAATLAAAQPEAMFRGVESDMDLRRAAQRADIVAIGPGLGQESWGRMLWSTALGLGKPLVVDADALNLLSAEPQQGDWILSPHPGEAARLLGLATSAVQQDRAAAARALQARYGGAVILKGAGSLVLDRSLSVCAHGNPGMGTGGMGDVLTGILAALWAQGLARADAAAAGVLVHALAADLAAQGGERGLLPGDVLAHLRAAVNP